MTAIIREDGRQKVAVTVRDSRTYKTIRVFAAWVTPSQPFSYSAAPLNDWGGYHARARQDAYRAHQIRRSTAWATELGFTPAENVWIEPMTGTMNSAKKCNARCLSAKPTSPCECSCGGRNHAGN